MPDDMDLVRALWSRCREAALPYLQEPGRQFTMTERQLRPWDEPDVDLGRTITFSAADGMVSGAVGAVTVELEALPG